MISQYEKRFYEDIHKLVITQKEILKELQKMNEPLQEDKAITTKEKPILTFENTGLAVTVYNQAKLDIVNKLLGLNKEVE